MEILSEVLHRAATKSVPSVTGKLNGPKRRVSPRVRELLKICRTTHKSWKYRHDDSNMDILFAERKLKKPYELRLGLKKPKKRKTLFLSLCLTLVQGCFTELSDATGRIAPPPPLNTLSTMIKSYMNPQNRHWHLRRNSMRIL